MTKISDIYEQSKLGLSIEIFPPKTDKGNKSLFENLSTLSKYQPGFISCTYGAGGTTQSRTLELCREIQRRFQIPATSHFTCVGSTRQDLIDWLTKAHSAGIKNIMALRGDPPQGEENFQKVEGGLEYANELVALIREQFPDHGIGVAAYPEKHPEAADAETDLENLKRKIDAGADVAFTQLFYSNENFLKFRDRYEAKGITIPLVPGIMPITEFARIKRITSMCGAVFPEKLASQLEAVQDDLSAQFEIGVEYAITQCEELIKSGVPGFHFYALNKSSACDKILQAVGFSKT